MKKILIILIAMLFFISSCGIKEDNELKEIYIKEKCEDGFEYNIEHCVNNKCAAIEYKQDPCLGHYLNKECNYDADCATGGCSSQVCTTKDKAIDIITTCEFRSSYECLKLTACSCEEGKCKFEENNNYLSCLAKYK